MAQSSSPAGRAELTLQAPPSQLGLLPRHRAPGSDCRPGPFGDEEWPGADMGCGVIQNPKDILGFAVRELSLPPAGCGTRMCLCGSSHAQGCSVCWVLPCAQWSHTEMCQHQVVLLDVLCHPSHAATLKATPRCGVPACRPCGWRASTAPSDRQQVRDAPGLFPSSVDSGELLSCRPVRGSWIVGPRVAHL